MIPDPTPADVGLPAGLTLNAASAVITGSPASAGNYFINLRATNSTGTGAATLNLAVSNPAPLGTPAASFTVIPQAGLGPLFVVCDASASTGGNLIYAWNFGDHSSGFGSAVTHTYTIPGTYAITLTVYNNFGADHTRQVINVGGH